MLKAYLPPEFWEHREYFLYEGMEIEIGPTQRKYEGNEAYEAATTRFLGGVWYPAWEGIGTEVRDLRTISDIIVNVQTGTGNRIEMWGNEGSPMPSKGKIRRYIDLGRLNRGR